MRCRFARIRISSSESTRGVRSNSGPNVGGPDESFPFTQKARRTRTESGIGARPNRRTDHQRQIAWHLSRGVDSPTRPSRHRPARHDRGGTMTAPPNDSPLARLIAGVPINQLEGSRGELRPRVADFEDAITAAEEREARQAARRTRNAG